MKTLRTFAVGLLFTALFAISAFAQAGAQSAGAGKIVVINTLAFDDPKAGAGITKYVSAMNTLETEFKPVQTELETMSVKLQNLSKEIQTLNGAGKVPVNQASVQAKIDEGEKLQRDLKFKQEDAKVRFEKRQQALLAPVMQDIYKAVSEFQKKNGYLLVLDISKMADNGTVLAMDETADVTKAFITFYNARPAGTATAAAPK
jgi:Skp family chaperone for outer membrane proteins